MPSSPSNRRGSDREQLYALMPVSLIVKAARSGERVVSGCLLDVSAEGLCLIVREELIESSRATLVTLDERITVVKQDVENAALEAKRLGRAPIEVIPGGGVRGANARHDLVAA